MWIVPFHIQRTFIPALRRASDFSAVNGVWGGELFVGGSAGRLVEREDSYVFTLAVPGAEPGDVEVEADANAVHVRAKMSADEGERRIRSGFWLPEDADGGKISASVKNGLARVIVGKKESARPRRIEVQ